MERNKENYYSSLYELAATLNSSRAPDSILQSVVEGVAKAMGAKGCSLMLLSPDMKVLLHTAAYGLSDWYVRKGPVSADKSISEALEGKPVAILDATEDHRIQYREQAKKEGIASILSVPMMLREDIIGVIRVYTAERHQFTMDDMYFAGGVANLGAIALENARLYEAVQRDYETFRQDMLEWRAALGHEWMVGEAVTPSEE
ncbi:MAG: GAF domain-containing protein [Thermodesulfobacteriota bacterium]|nr:GAF domain-containing protein [Thermodesulfobacteriota bacterium]